MNRTINTGLSQTTSKVNWRYKGLLWGFIFTLGVINSGCNNSVSDSGNEIDENEYYVKYEVNSSTIYHGGKLEVTINAEDNSNTTIVINQRQLWEVIVGPVQNGFNASLNVKAVGSTHDRLTLYAAIYVSKNNSPFAIKNINGSETPRNSVRISYTIDY